MSAKVRIKRLPSGDCTFGTGFRSDPKFFCHPNSKFSTPDSVPYLFRSLLCQLLPTHVCQGAYTRLLLELHIRNRIFAQIRHFFAIQTRNFPNRIQLLTLSSRSYANFCLLMCAKMRIHSAFCKGCTSGTGFSLRSGIFLPSKPGIFQTGSSSLPFPVAPMPASAYSSVPRCVYTVNASLLHIWNRFFAQIRNFSFVGCGPGAYIIIIIIIVIHTTFNIMQKQCPAETTKLSTQTMTRGACGSNLGSFGRYCKNILNIEYTVLILVMPSLFLIHRSDEK